MKLHPACNQSVFNRHFNSFFALIVKINPITCAITTSIIKLSIDVKILLIAKDIVRTIVNYLPQLLETRTLRFFPILYNEFVKFIFFDCFSGIGEKIFPSLLDKFDPERVKGVKGRKWRKRHRVFLRYKSLLSPAPFPIKLVRLGVHQVVPRVEIILPLVFIVGHG